MDKKTNKIVEVKPPQALQSVILLGDNAFYPRATYYQAIEKKFPEFGSLISMKGSVKYSTFKKIMFEKNPNPEAIKFLQLVGNSTKLDAYYFDTNKKTDPELDRLISLVQNGDWTIGKILNGENLATIHYGQDKTEGQDIKETSDNQTLVSKNLLAVLALVLAVTISGLFFFWRKRKVSPEIITP